MKEKKKTAWYRRVLSVIADLMIFGIALLIACLFLQLLPSSNSVFPYAAAVYLVTLDVNLAIVYGSTIIIQRSRASARAAVMLGTAIASAILSTIIVQLICLLLHHSLGIIFFSLGSFFGVPLGTVIAAALLFVRTVALPLQHIAAARQ